MIALLVTAALLAAPAKPRAPAQPLDIKADHLTVMTKDNRGFWKGHVHAVREATPEQPQLDLRCDEMVTDFMGEDKLEKATCDGNVEVVQGDRMGWGQHAVYDSAQGQVVVTGEPHGQQGPNKFEGDTLTFFLDEDRVEVTRPKLRTPPPARADAGAGSAAPRPGASR